MIGITQIEQIDNRTLAIKWSDDKISKLDVVVMRKECPCASCVDEWTGKRMEMNVDETVRPKIIESVGRYAIKVNFSDNHNTGIYSYQKLRELNLGDKL